MTDPLLENVTVEFTVAVGNDRLKASATVPGAQTNLTQILPVLQSLDSSFVEGICAKVAADGRSISCKAGCGACCRQMVPISIFEAEALCAWILTLPEERRQQLAQRFHQALLALAAGGIIDRIVKEDWNPESDSGQQLNLDYFYQHVACPFLENESCSIYPIRPLICREYLVTSPAEHCSDPVALGTDTVRLPLLFSRVLISIGAELEHDARGWIPLVFLFGWMKSGSHPGEAVAGAGPQVLYEFVKRLNRAEFPSLAPKAATEE